MSTSDLKADPKNVDESCRKLLSALGSQYAPVRRFAINELSTLKINWAEDRRSKEAILALAPSLVDSDAEIRKQVKDLLAKIDPEWAAQASAVAGMHRILRQSAEAYGFLNAKDVFEMLDQLDPKWRKLVPPDTLYEHLTRVRDNHQHPRNRERAKAYLTELPESTTRPK